MTHRFTLAAALLAVLQLPPICAAEPSVASITQDLQWRLVGPFRGGRTRAVTGIPGSPGTFLVGAVNGGVWRTDDFGRSWVPLFDAQPTQSIGAIAVAPSNPKIIYVASGEGLQRPDLSVGNGVYRSADAGRTWTHLGLDDAQQIPDLAVDPRDPNRLYAAVMGHPFGPSAQRGIYRSTDGGVHWVQVLFRDENTGGSGIKMDPQDPNVLYASLWNVRSGPWEDNNVFNGSGGGLFKSVDGGEHWRALKQGLPEDLSQIEIAIAPSRPGRLYATIATTQSGEYSSAAGLGVYRSDDAGETWRRITTDPRPALRIGGGDLPIIKVDPSNADLLYSATIVTVKSIDGGAHWSSLRGAPGGDDYQNLWISPDDPRHIALVGDQGAIITANGGETWSSWFIQPTAQLYHIGVTGGFPYRICSGQQESGSVCIATRGNDGEITAHDWHPIGAIEYGTVVPDPLDPDIVYGAGRNEVSKASVVTGQVQNVTPIPIKGADVRVDRTEPLFFSPQDPHKLYYAANRLYSTSDGGLSWSVASPDLTREDPGVPASVGSLLLPKAAKQRGVIYAASASSLQSGLIWLGTDDGLIWVDRNGAQHWENVTPPQLTPWSKVTQIEASHFDPQVAYASVSRFRIDDLKPYIYRTRDGGNTWQLITTGLAQNAPANTVREDPARRGLLYAGTENAVWVSFDDGDHWSSLQLNLPATSMRDLAVHGEDLIVATHGRSFWILDDLGPLRGFGPTLGASAAVLLKPAAAVRTRRSTWTDTPIPPDEPVGRNPPDGAVIDYYLSRGTTEPLAIEILDSSGAVLRRVSTTDKAQFTPEELQRELIPPYWIRIARPPVASPGMHRWVWDLHCAAPRTAQRGFPISAVPADTPQEPLGPLAAPGTYRVRLSFGKQQWEQPLSIVVDPRVKVSAEALDAQYALSKRLAAALDASTGALLEARSLRAQLKDIKTPSDAALGERLHGFDQRAASLIEAAESEKTLGAEPPRRLEHLNGDIATLYGELSRADAAPTRAQLAEAERAIKDWQALEAQWAQLRKVELAALNSALRKARLPALIIELAPPRDLDLADQE
ncbi:MAG TPA: hypothetical protein VKG05_14690 [Steroidobacteraceae bacterium]|nr:hypothetical protein [Steroidobacteraceae bacterium]